MRNLFALLLTILLPTMLAAQTNSIAQSQPLAFVHATVIDMTGSPPKSDMTVVAQGERIVEIGKTGKVRVPRKARIVDATGKFLIPGLSDMHVHCLMEGRPDFCFPLFVANGITSVRDMGGSFPSDVVRSMRADIAAGRLVGPRLLAAPGKIIDGPFPTPREAYLSVNSPAEARRAVAASKAPRWAFV